MKDEVFDKYISDNEEELEKLLRCVEENHARAISSFEVFNKSNQDQIWYCSIMSCSQYFNSVK